MTMNIVNGLRKRDALYFEKKRKLGCEDTLRTRVTEKNFEVAIFSGKK